MGEFLTFCIGILSEIVKSWFSLDLGGYKFGDFMVGLLVIAVFISSLVVSFRHPVLHSSDMKPFKTDKGGKDE